MFFRDISRLTFPGMDSTCIHKRPNAYRRYSPRIENKHLDVLDGRVPDCSHKFFPILRDGRKINISQPDPPGNFFNSVIIYPSAFFQVRRCVELIPCIRHNGNNSHRNTHNMAIPKTPKRNVEIITGKQQKAEHFQGIPLFAVYMTLSVLFFFIREITSLNISDITCHSIVYNRTQIRIPA